MAAPFSLAKHFGYFSQGIFCRIYSEPTVNGEIPQFLGLFCSKEDPNPDLMRENSFSGSGAGIFKQSMAARNRVGIGLSYWPAKLHRLAELIPWNRLGSLKV